MLDLYDGKLSRTILRRGYGISARDLSRRMRMTMSEILTIVILTGTAGSCIPIGGVIASFEHVRSDWLEKEFRHFLIAFGGGILLGAVAVVLVPEGISSMNGSMFAIPIILAGGLLFFIIERVLGEITGIAT